MRYNLSRNASIKISHTRRFLTCSSLVHLSLKHLFTKDSHNSVSPYYSVGPGDDGKIADNPTG